MFSFAEIATRKERFIIENDWEFENELLLQLTKTEEVNMSEANNTTETTEEVVKDTTEFTFEEVQSGGDYVVLPEASMVLAHLAAITIERDVKDNFGKTDDAVFIGAKFYFEVADNEDNFPAENYDGRENTGEVILMPYSNFHTKISFNEKSNFMKLVNIINGKPITEEMLEPANTKDFFMSLIGKPVYVDITNTVSKTDSSKKYANIGKDIYKTKNEPSKSWDTFELSDNQVKNQCNVYHA